MYELYDKDDSFNLIIVLYFMFTTLSTVGFGDFNPKSELERGIMTFILLIGVACSSYIMSQFISIVLDLQKITASNEDSEKMAEWLQVLKNYNNHKPVPLDMVAEFERYFEYYWQNDKTYAMVSEEDLAILDELPEDIQNCIFKDFLFKDFLS